MLGLKLPTDPRWVNIVEKHIGDILTDHAYCEQKAASNAITLMVRYPEYEDLVTTMSDIAIEEMQHFQMVHAKLKERGLKLGKEQKDDYVNKLASFNNGGTHHQVYVDRMLFAAMIEARSCERFKLLSEQLEDEDLRAFYRDLMESEARHYVTFLNLAKKYCGDVDVDSRWAAFLEFEAELLRNYGTKQEIHG